MTLQIRVSLIFRQDFLVEGTSDDFLSIHKIFGRNFWTRRNFYAFEISKADFPRCCFSATFVVLGVADRNFYGEIFFQKSKHQIMKNILSTYNMVIGDMLTILGTFEVAD